MCESISLTLVDGDVVVRRVQEPPVPLLGRRLRRNLEGKSQLLPNF